MSRKRTLIYFACQIIGWGAYVGIGFAFYAASDKNVASQWLRYASAFGCCAITGILTTHWYRFYVKRNGWLLLPLGKAIPRVLASTVTLTIVITVQVSLVWWLFRIGTFTRWDWVAPALFGWMWPCFLWNVLYFGTHYFEQYRKSEMEKLQLAVVAKEAQLQSLVAQVNPHFMFNCLNGVRALITEDPERAKEMVTRLSELLRYSLQSGSSVTVPLRAELEMVNTYLKLEASRFEERLAVKIEAAPETLSVAVPTMMVQSLVENGVKHGIEKLSHGGEIRVSSRLQDHTLEIQVVNSGQLGDGGRSTGIGLANARERLRLLYGNAARLVVANQDAERVRAEISIPVSGEPVHEEKG
jgi:signal transduction histidine kinase